MEASGAAPPAPGAADVEGAVAAADRGADDLPDEVFVGEAGSLRREGQATLGGEIAVWIDVDDERVASRVDAEVDTAVVAEPQHLEGAPANGGELPRFGGAEHRGVLADSWRTVSLASRWSSAAAG